ncbi:MAG: FlgB family protein [Roseinatronobacter sp.]
MFDIPDVMRVAQAMARHSAARQVVISENMAQANTPGYQRRDLPSFSDAYRAPLQTARGGQGGLDLFARPDRQSITQAPNGNTVSIEREMIHAAQVRQDHDTAMAVYASARSVLRTALGR